MSPTARARYTLSSHPSRLSTFAVKGGGDGSVVGAATQLITMFMVNSCAATQVACFADTNGVLSLMKLE